MEAASDSLECLLALCRREGWKDLEASVLLHLGTVLSQQGRVKAAERSYRDVLALDAASQKNRTEAVIGLAASLVARNRASEAGSLLGEASARMGSGGDPSLISGIETATGECLLAGRDPQSALRVFRQAEERASRLGLAGLRIPALCGLARSLDLTGDPIAARRTLETAAALWDSTRGSPLDPEWREVRGESARRICTDLAALILETTAGPEDERIRLSYERAQSFKTRTLLERMAGPMGSRGDSHTTTANRGLGLAASLRRSAIPPSRGSPASVSTRHDSVRLRASRSVAPDSTSE